jgi:hypothetical protein
MQYYEEFFGKEINKSPPWKLTFDVFYELLSLFTSPNPKDV